MVKLLVNGLELETDSPLMLYNNNLSVTPDIWTSVKLGLPNLLEKVLFVYAIDNVIYNIASGYYSSAGWAIYAPYDSICLKSETVTVTHWMPLPQFPKEIINGLD